MPAEIIVDDRERACGLVEALRAATGRPVTVRRLRLGDAEAGGVIVERKEAADFVASLMDGRLARQLDALTRAGGPVVVIVEGEFDARALAGMAAQEVRRALVSIQLDARVPVLRSRDVADTARWIAVLAERESADAQPFAAAFKPIPGQTAPRPGLRRSPRPAADGQGPRDVPLAALRRVPGVGPAKAEALLRRFGSIQAILAAGEAGLSAAEGIGPALARAITRALTGR